MYVCGLVMFYVFCALFVYCDVGVSLYVYMVVVCIACLWCACVRATMDRVCLLRVFDVFHVWCCALQ